MLKSHESTRTNRRLPAGTPVVSTEDAEPGRIVEVCMRRRNGVDAWSYLVETRYGREIWEAGELFVPDQDDTKGTRTMTTNGGEASSHDDGVCELLESLEITSIKARYMGGGVWVHGTIGGHRFEALVFSEHAESASYELDGSRISKLCVRRIEDQAIVANFDRGWDVRPTTPIAGQIVTLLAECVAGVAFQD